ncbi:MAG: ABC transporter substrate-binding protein [Bacteroidetes bacterium]|nr:ABC transporter substrate-binding protein [Bacteroidota bacterium]
MILSSTDQLGYIPKRIISLVPSQTELLHYLSLETETIGITKFCIHPDTWFRNKTRVGGTKNVNIEKVKELRPDLIIANKEENVKEQMDILAQQFPTWVTDVNCLEDSFAMINDIGRLTGKEMQAVDLVDKCRKSFNLLYKENISKNVLSAIYIIWKNPIMTIGGDTFISSMLEKAGFRNSFKNLNRYPEITIEDINNSGCELVFLSSEPYPFSQKHIDEFSSQLPGKKIILVDGEMFSWYGSRLLAAPSYFQKLYADINKL